MEQSQRRNAEDAGLTGERAEAIGAYLKRQRRLRGIALEELAATTRIPLRSLQRLETGAFDREPDGFARGFVRTVAVALGLPPDETVARMLPEASDDDLRRGRRRELGRRALVAGGVLALVLLGVLVWSGARVLPTGWTHPRDELHVRRDAVRALAEEQRAKDHDAAPPPASIAPEQTARPKSHASAGAGGAGARSEPKASEAHKAAHE